MDHEKDRAGSEYWHIAQEHVVDRIRNKCGQEQFTEEDINRAIGVLEVGGG